MHYTTFKKWLTENWRDPDGEWWIQDGSAQFADGDVGDMNHEAMALQSIRADITSKLSHHYSQGEWVDWHQFKNDLAERMYEELKDENRNNKLYLLKIEAMWDQNPDWFLEQGRKKLGINDDEWYVADGHGDIRDYAMEHLGWKRVAGGNVETWTLNRDDIGDLASGLGEILGEMGEEYDNYPWSIHIISTNKTVEMTIGQMEQAISGQQAPRQVNVDQNLANRAAGQFAQRQDFQNLHPYYQNRSFPFGDWVRARGKVLT